MHFSQVACQNMNIAMTAGANASAPLLGSTSQAPKIIKRVNQFDLNGHLDAIHEPAHAHKILRSARKLAGLKCCLKYVWAECGGAGLKDSEAATTIRNNPNNLLPYFVSPSNGKSRVHHIQIFW